MFYDGEPVGTEDIVKELGDCLWYIQEIAFETGIDLSEKWNDPIDQFATSYVDTEIEAELHRLNVEAGAVAEIAKKQLRDKAIINNNELKAFLTDYLHTIKTIAANVLYPTFQDPHVLSHVAAMNLEKLQQRQMANTLKGSGDDR
jgi:hypothetical protein